MMDKIVNPTKTVKIVGGLLGGVIGYGHSYFLYKRDYGIVPLKLQVLPTISYGFLGYTWPILPITLSSIVTAIVLFNQTTNIYGKWERKVIREYTSKEE
jgi:hypothetical protein